MATVSSLSTLCCQGLIALLGAQNVMFPGTIAYNATLSSYFSPLESAVYPLCFVTPQSAADVSVVVKSLTSTNSCDFAVRSGGHMWFAGAANIQAGVTIDLRGLGSIDVHTNNSTVSVGPGTTWDKVYAKLENYDLSVAGGRVGGVGVGGLTLGGGISFFGPRYGWTCNQAVSFQVVLADGSIVIADKTHNSDLWWGLRGGSNNFGIVTRFELTTFSQGPIWYAETYDPLTVVPDQARIYSSLMKAENYDINASFLFGWGFSAAAGLSVATNQLVYTKPIADQNPAYYAEVLSLPSVVAPPPVIANMSTIAVSSESAEPPQVARYASFTTSFVATEAMILAAFDSYNKSLLAVQNIPGIVWPFVMEPIPPQLYGRGAADNALGLATRSGTFVVVALSPAWQNQADDATVLAAAKALISSVEAKAKALGVYDPYIYLNYAAPWQNVIASYGKASVTRLQLLRARVDPGGVFTFKAPGGPKIPL